eukprot:g29273.t1
MADEKVTKEKEPDRSVSFLHPKITNCLSPSKVTWFVTDDHFLVTRTSHSSRVCFSVHEEAAYSRIPSHNVSFQDSSKSAGAGAMLRSLVSLSTALIARFTYYSSYPECCNNPKVDQGGRMEIDLKLSAYHAGWFEFRLCVPSDGGFDYSRTRETGVFQPERVKIHPDTPGYPSLTNLAGSILDYGGMKGLSGTNGGGFKCAVGSGGIRDPTATSPNTVWPSGTCCNNGGTCSDPLNNRDRYVTEFGGPGRNGGSVSYKVMLRVPTNIQCERCVLQWTYVTANSRDTYPETFWNCADVKIVPAGNSARLPSRYNSIMEATLGFTSLS